MYLKIHHFSGNLRNIHVHLSYIDDHSDDLIWSSSLNSTPTISSSLHCQSLVSFNEWAHHTCCPSHQSRIQKVRLINNQRRLRFSELFEIGCAASELPSAIPTRSPFASLTFHVDNKTRLWKGHLTRNYYDGSVCEINVTSAHQYLNTHTTLCVHLVALVPPFYPRFSTFRHNTIDA